MPFKVVLNMNDSSALITVAMLSTMLKERNADYLELISPFVLTLLPNRIGDAVDINTIIRKLSADYGFEHFPALVVEKILNRYGKQKHGYVEKRYNVYYVKKLYESEKFFQNQSKIRDAQSQVINQLCKYLRNNSRYSDIDENRSRELFLLFLEQKGLVFVNGIEQLRTITSKDYDIFQVARFVLEEHKNRSTTYGYIVEVVRGFFVYKSIYFFGRDGDINTLSLMKGTTVYFDTPFLIEALGWNSQEGKLAALELMRLISDCGGSMKTFTHLVDEVQGILRAFGRDVLYRSTFSLQYLLDKQYDQMDISRLIGTLEEKLSSLNISVVNPVSMNELNSNEFLPLQVNDFSGEIEKLYRLDYPTTRSDNDVLSIASIYRLRGNASAKSLNNCTAVLVTTNTGLVNIVEEFYKSITTHTVRYIMSDIDLTSILWLCSWQEKSNLPSIVLLENAYAACAPTKELLDVFGSTIDKLLGEGIINKDEALILRTQYVPRENLIEITQNDPSKVNDKMVLEILQSYSQSLIEDKNKEVAELKQSLLTSKKREEERKAIAIDRAEALATKEADNYETLLKIVFNAIIIISFTIGILTLLWNLKTPNNPWIVNIISFFIGGIGLLDMFRGRSSVMSRFISQEKSKRFSKVHGREMERVLRDFF